MDAAAAREWRCQQRLLEFFGLLDDKRYEPIAELFTAEGEWLRPGALSRGHSEILTALNQRPAGRHTRHLVTNFLVLEDSGAEVGARAFLTTYAYESGTRSQVTGPAGIYLAEVVFECSAAGEWIRRLELAPDIVINRPAA